MRLYVTIDGGTTNTRVGLVQDRRVIATVKLSFGCGSEGYARALQDTIPSLLQEHGFCEQDVTCVLASGMITSEKGLVAIPHLTAPVGLAELNRGLLRTELPEITSLPFVFVPGVKVGPDSFGNADMMRGEETEVFGIEPTDAGRCAYVLPGSHSKIITMDVEQRICGIATMMTGEMIAALSGHTILRDAVSLSVSEFRKEALMQGYLCCEENGINYALFQTRVRKNLMGADPVDSYSFFLGVVLHDELCRIRDCGCPTVVLGGQKQLRAAMAALLSEISEQKVILLSEDQVAQTVFLGAVRIYEAVDQTN